MKKLIVAGALLAAGSLGLQDVSLGHGGTYRGPGDTVPPGGGAGGGGGGPAAPGPAGPAAPAAPGTPGAAPGTPGAPAAGPAQPVSGQQLTSGPDLTQWTFWWEFNKDPYINLRNAILTEETTTGGDDFFLGQGQQEQSKNTYRPTAAQIRDNIVPALIKALETENNNDIVTGSLIALAKIGDAPDESGESKFEKLFLPWLADPNQEIRETAAIALGILANPNSVPTLLDLFNDTATGRKLVGTSEVGFRTRSFAGYGLALVGSQTSDEEVRKEIVANLVASLEKDLTRARDIKVAALSALGLIPLETIEPPTAPEEGEMPAPSESRVGQLEFVLDYLNRDKENFLIRAHAPTALARLLMAEGLPADLAVSYKAKISKELLERADDRTKARKEVVQSAVLALGMIGDTDSDKVDKDIRKALFKVSKEVADPQAKAFSVIALGQIGGRAGASDPASNADGIKEIQKELLTKLGKGKVTNRPWTGIGIGVMGRALIDSGSTVPSDLSTALRSALEDEGNPTRVGAYAIGAGMIGDQESKSILLKKLDKLNDDIPRGYVAVALGLLKDNEAIEPIQAIIKKSKYRPELLQQAAIALGLLGDKNMVLELVDMLKDARSLSTQAAIAGALGFIGDSRSVTPLIGMLQDKGLTESARGFAAVALGIVADKQDLPWNSSVSVDLNYRASAETLNDQTGTGILNIL